MKALHALCLCALCTVPILSSCHKKQPVPAPAPDPFVELSTPASLDIPAEGGTAAISFLANHDWTVSSSGQWCTVSPVSGKASESAATVTVTLDPNDNEEVRTATVTIETGEAVKTVTVTQAAAEKTYITNLQAVDLGLSVLWADRDLGADSPYEYGDYYAWGETETKLDYTWNNYRWSEGTNRTLTKYNTRSDFGVVDNITRLEEGDDAAWVNTAGEWRIPTDDEITELRSQCTREWLTIDNVSADAGLPAKSTERASSSPPQALLSVRNR